jgi:hypothetical protein
MTMWKVVSAVGVVLLAFNWLPGAVAESTDAVDTEAVEPIAEPERTEEQEEAEDEEEIEFPPEIEELLTEASESEEYAGERVDCIQSRSIRDTKILDNRHIVFEMAGNTYYLIQFKHRCPQLRRTSTLVYETRANRLCRLDFIKAANSFRVGDVGPPCSIPGFIPITVEQIALLDETLKAASKR